MATYVLLIAGRQVEVEVEDVAATPEQAAFQADVAEGIGDPREAELAARVQAMSLEQFAQFRREHGMQQDLVSFLGGTDQ